MSVCLKQTVSFLSTSFNIDKKVSLSDSFQSSIDASSPSQSSFRSCWRANKKYFWTISGPINTGLSNQTLLSAHQIPQFFCFSTVEKKDENWKEKKTGYKRANWKGRKKKDILIPLDIPCKAWGRAQTSLECSSQSKSTPGRPFHNFSTSKSIDRHFRTT